jgi:hypothetical protein
MLNWYALMTLIDVKQQAFKILHKFFGEKNQQKPVILRFLLLFNFMIVVVVL